MTTDIKQLAISHTTLDPQSGHTCNDAQVLAREYLWVIKRNELLEENLKHFSGVMDKLKENNIAQLKSLTEENATLRHECVRLVGAMHVIGHECLHSHENCPTREQMQLNARKTLASCPESVRLAEKQK